MEVMRSHLNAVEHTSTSQHFLRGFDMVATSMTLTTGPMPISHDISNQHSHNQQQLNYVSQPPRVVPLLFASPDMGVNAPTGDIIPADDDDESLSDESLNDESLNDVSLSDSDEPLASKRHVEQVEAFDETSKRRKLFAGGTQLHPRFWEEDGDVVLKIGSEDLLFKLRRSNLTRQSQFFAELFDRKTSLYYMELPMFNVTGTDFKDFEALLLAFDEIA